MAATIYTLSRIRIGSTVLPAQNVNIQDSVVAAPQSHSGLQNNDNLLVSGAEAPRITASIPWGEAYALFGWLPLPITTCEVYLGTLTGGVVGAADAIRYAINSRAIGYITGMSVSQDGVAMADIEVICLSSDGAADPLTKSTAQTPPAVSQPSLYTIGGVTINGTAVDGVTGMSLSRGWSAQTQRSDGDYWPGAAVCGGAAATITMQHIDPVAVRDILASGGVGITSNAVVTLQGVAQATGVVGGTTQTLTVANGYVTPGGINLPHVGIAGTSFTIHAISSTGNDSGVVVA